MYNMIVFAMLATTRGGTGSAITGDQNVLGKAGGAGPSRETSQSENNNQNCNWEEYR